MNKKEKNHHRGMLGKRKKDGDRSTYSGKEEREKRESV